MVEFALAIQHQLSVFNEDLLNFDFVCKLGLNIGPLTAGVIGTTKLYYDIWGDTVNIASRMYSTGVINRIQVREFWTIQKSETFLITKDKKKFWSREGGTFCQKNILHYLITNKSRHFQLSSWRFFR